MKKNYFIKINLEYFLTKKIYFFVAKPPNLLYNIAMIEIREVKTRKERKDFVDFPIKLYAHCPYYVPNLRGDEFALFNPIFLTVVVTWFFMLHIRTTNQLEEFVELFKRFIIKCKM